MECIGVWPPGNDRIIRGNLTDVHCARMTNRTYFDDVSVGSALADIDRLRAPILVPDHEGTLSSRDNAGFRNGERGT